MNYKRYSMSDVKKTGDYDALMKKWNDVLTRNIDWKLRECLTFDEGNEVKIFCADGKQFLYFRKRRSKYKEDLYGEEKESAYGFSIEIAYSPELPNLDESGHHPSKVLTFLWNYYLHYSVKVGYSKGNYYDDDYNDFDTTSIFSGYYDEKKGEARLDTYAHGQREKPKITGFEPVVGSEFYGNLMKFCEKMENLAKTGKKMKDDEFDSL